MAGCSLRYGGELPAGPNAMQQEVIDRVEGLMKVMEPTSRPPHTEAAYRELLKGRSVYEVESGNVNLAAYQEELLSVPDDVRDCPLVSDVLPAGARHYLEAYHERMLRTPEEFEEAERTGPYIQPYFDARLKYNKKAYYRFVQKLQAVGLLDFTLHPKEVVGVFFVWKSNKQAIRLIIDARRSNRRFRVPPGVSLCTAEGFSRIELELPAGVDPNSEEGIKMVNDTVIHVGLADVKDFFHRMRAPAWLRPFFCLPAVPAHVVGLSGQEVDGRRLSHSDEVHPCCGSLCMGFLEPLLCSAHQ